MKRVTMCAGFLPGVLLLGDWARIRGQRRAGLGVIESVVGCCCGWWMPPESDVAVAQPTAADLNGVWL
jgi:hypothetical protein